MLRSLHSSKKGLGTVIGAAFFIGLVLFSLISIVIINSYQSNYLDVRDNMVDWDIGRTSELINITRIDQPSNSSNYTFDIIVNNHGGVLVRIIRAYIYDNTFQNLTIYDRQNNSSDIGLNGSSCEIIQGDGGHAIRVNASSSLLTSPYNRYRVVICTERGRQFSYSYPPLPPPSGPETLGEYPIIIAAKDKNFEYNSWLKSVGNLSGWKSAYVKPKGNDAQIANVTYRILLNNTTNRRIYLHENSTMLQMIGAVGSANPRYIMDNRTLPNSPIPYATPQSIEPSSSTYLIFGAESPGGIDFQSEGSQGFYLVGFLLRFNFEGDPEIRYISMPATPQELV